MNYLCDLGYLLYAEDKVILTSQMCCESLPKKAIGPENQMYKERKNFD